MSDKFTNNFDIFGDFKKHDEMTNDNIELNKIQDNIKHTSNIELEKMILINDNIRNNINLSIAIYKKLNNFNHYNIHNTFK